MANYVKWGAPSSAISLLGTEMNSLGNNTLSALGTEYDNSSNRYPFADFELVLGSLTPTSGGFVSLYLAPELDGSNYPDAKRESMQMYIGGFSLDTAAAGKRTTIKGVQLPPSKFKVYVDNQAGVSLNASGNTVKGFAYGPEIQ